MSTNASDLLSIELGQITADVVIRYPFLRRTLEDLGVDYCCNGNRPLQDAALHAGLDPKVLLDTLRKAKSPQKSEAYRDWSKASVTELANHILETHHVFTKEQLPRGRKLLDRVVAAHSDNHGVMLKKLSSVYRALHDELDSHLMKEEEILFPGIKAIDAYCQGHGPKPVIHCGKVAYPIRQMIFEHDNAGGLLAELRSLTDGYTLPDDACQTFGSLYETLVALEDDLHEHIHLENNVLFPASIKLEESISPCHACHA